MAARAHCEMVVRPGRPSLKTRLYRAATSPAAKAAYIAVGAAGVAALAIAIFGPRRFKREIVRPMRNAISDQTLRLWAESRPLRAQLADLIERARSERTRDKLVRSFQSWIGHFRAT
ncbi:MAG: hypothetical protein ACREFW_00705 [Rhizomicrobium sp.]